MPLINKSFIADRLMPAIDIEKFISQYLPLKKSGAQSFTCCCPFHKEKSPSFTVTPSKGMFYCFGCKEHGTVLDFIMKYKNLNFVEAVQEAAQYAGLEVVYEEGGSIDKEQLGRFNLYYDLMDKCASFFTSCLYQNREALEYFAKKRGLSEETIVKSRLGFAPNSYENYFKVTTGDNEAYTKALVELGMLKLSEKNNQPFPMFRGRVIIPILDIKGRVISFGGRTLGDEKPKYLNTSESPIFKKRKELFGLYEVLKAHNNRPSRIVIVEGYMDVIALRQYGLDIAVASLGTATTENQLRLMFRYTSQVICLYDGDNAGRKAAEHAFETITPFIDATMDMRFAFLPAEHDPDSLVREGGADAVNAILDSSQSYPEFLIKSQQQRFNLSDPSQMAIFLNSCIEIIGRITDDVLCTICIRLLASTLNIEQSVLFSMLKQKSVQKKNNAYTRQESEVKKEDSRDLLNTPMRRLIAFILQQPMVVQTYYEKYRISEFVSLCSKAKVRGVGELEFYLSLIHRDNAVSTAAILESVRETKRERTVRALVDVLFIPKKSDGSELSIEDRAELFFKLIAQTLYGALSDRVESLKLMGNNISQKQLEEMFALNKIINRRYN